MSSKQTQTDQEPAEHPMNGAEIVLKALMDQGVDTIFGYPGGAVLPLYDAIFEHDQLNHILVRHEQGAAHAAEGYARTTGKPGVLMVTSGPGATNAVTGLTDAMLDSIPLVCITGQVATPLIGCDAFQEADTVGITRHATKHNWLVKDVNDLARTIHEAFYVATHGRPGPVVIDLPKDVQISKGPYLPPKAVEKPSYRPTVKGDEEAIRKAVQLLSTAKKPVFYTGGGLINSGPEACEKLRELVRGTGFPITSTLMGLGAYPGTDEQFLGMLGMHGTYEANMAMHDCDLMICVGARFDDRITGRLDAFSPGSTKIHIDVDRSSINKNIMVDLPIVGDAGSVLGDMLDIWQKQNYRPNGEALKAWWAEIAEWRAKDCLHYTPREDVIMPQQAIQRLYELTRDKKPIIATEVGQHQMWAAQFCKFDEPYHWLTSGGLGTMGYGLPAAIGAQVAHPEALCIDIAGEASIQMNIQELATAVQHDLAVKVFIINNQYMGMVRQWQELGFNRRYSHSYSDALPDFARLAEAFGASGLRCTKPSELDETIQTMLETPGPVVVDCAVAQLENCFPMVPSGNAHHEMILGSDAETGSITGEDLAHV